MKALQFASAGERLSVLCLGAHSDDIEIGDTFIAHVAHIINELGDAFRPSGHESAAPTPEQIYLALGAAGEGGSSFDKLKNSILSSKGIVQPIIVNRVDGCLVCVEGNTRVAIYRSFIDEGVAGNWTQIPAMVYANLSEDRVEAIRFQSFVPCSETILDHSRPSIFSKLGTNCLTLQRQCTISETRSAMNPQAVER